MYFAKKNIMKKTLILFMLPMMMFAQKTQTFSFNKPIKDRKNTTKSLTVIEAFDGNRDSGAFTTKGATTTFLVTEGVLKSNIENKFSLENKNPGTRDLVLVVKRPLVSNEEVGKTSLARIKLKAAVFSLKDGNYYFVKGLDSQNLLDPRNTTNMGEYAVSSAAASIQNLITESYNTEATSFIIEEQHLGNFDEFMLSQLPAMKNSKLTDGVYLDVFSFYNQTPSGHQIVKDEFKQVKKAVKEGNNIRSERIFVYVEDGKPFKRTASGFWQMYKGEKGYFLIANKGILQPEEMNSAYGMFGLTGALIGAIATDMKNEKAKNEDKKRVYVDFFTGNYIYQD